MRITVIEICKRNRIFRSKLNPQGAKVLYDEMSVSFPSSRSLCLLPVTPYLLLYRSHKHAIDGVRQIFGNEDSLVLVLLLFNNLLPSDSNSSNK